MSISAISAVSPTPMAQAPSAASAVPGAFQQALAGAGGTAPANTTTPPSSAQPTAHRAHHHGGHGHGGAAPSSSQASTLLATLSGMSSGSVDISA